MSESLQSHLRFRAPSQLQVSFCPVLASLLPHRRCFCDCPQCTSCAESQNCFPRAMLYPSWQTDPAWSCIMGWHLLLKTVVLGKFSAERSTHFVPYSFDPRSLPFQHLPTLGQFPFWNAWRYIFTSTLLGHGRQEVKPWQFSQPKHTITRFNIIVDTLALCGGRFSVQSS